MKASPYLVERPWRGLYQGSILAVLCTGVELSNDKHTQQIIYPTLRGMIKTTLVARNLSERAGSTRLTQGSTLLLAKRRAIER